MKCTRLLFLGILCSTPFFSTTLYSRCACAVGSHTFFNTPTPQQMNRMLGARRMHKAHKNHILWSHTDPDSDTTWILVQYMQPTGVGAYMTAPYYTFTKTTPNPPRHFTTAWTIQDPSLKKHAKVYSIKKTSWKKPHHKNNHAYKWVKLEDIRQNPKVKNNTFIGITVVAKDGTRIWIDKKLARALVKKEYHPYL